MRERERERGEREERERERERVESAYVPRLSVDHIGTNCDQCRFMVQCCFTSTETIMLC